MPRNVRGKANVMDSVYGGLPRGESALRPYVTWRGFAQTTRTMRRPSFGSIL